MSGLVPEAFSHDPSATGIFAALPVVPADEKPTRKLRAVVIGGGTGAPMSIRTLLSMGIETSAVVAMADDGGSTGILRDQAGATAPGDIRKCISAMAADSNDAMTKAFKVRFGFAENHTLGNLMLSALEVTSGGFPEAIRVCEELLDARGHVYPSTLERVTLVAKTRDGRTLEGQAVASHSRTALRKVALRSEGSLQAYGPALEAVRQADLIVLGPGSLFTSIIPNLLVDGIVDSIRAAAGIVAFVCSIADMQGETRGMSVSDHYEALASHGMAGRIDYAFVQRVPTMGQDGAPFARSLVATRGDVLAIEGQGTRVVAADFAEKDNPTLHDPVKLRHAFAEVLKTCRSTRT